MFGNCQKLRPKYPPDGQPIENKSQERYLGVINAEGYLTEEELQSRIQKAMITARKLNIFWKQKTKCDTQWKLLVYNAVVIASLIDGIESKTRCFPHERSQSNTWH